MPKVKISEFSATPSNNTDIDGINIAEGCAPSGINDAIRELMSQLKDFQTGAAGDSFNGPVGATTANTGAFTTLTTSGAVTHNAGTANGVAYLNGSKVLTTGSALTFDGTALRNTSGQFEGIDNMTLSALVSGTNATVLTLNSAGTSGTTRFQINNAEQMRLTSTGLGIGTSSPGARLQVTQGAGNDLQARLLSLDNFTGEVMGVAFSRGDSALTSAVGAVLLESLGLFSRENIIFATGGNNQYVQTSERARITANGDLLVGTTSSSMAGLSGIRLGTGNAGIVLAEGGTNRGYLFNATTSASINLESVSGTTIRAISGASGGVSLANGATSWAALSDERHKDIIEPISNAADKVASLRAVIGKYKTDAEGTRRSFLIAQDVQAVLPEAIDNTDTENLALRYSDLIPVLVKAIQEQQALIQTLTARVAALESN